MPEPTRICCFGFDAGNRRRMGLACPNGVAPARSVLCRMIASVVGRICLLTLACLCGQHLVALAQPPGTFPPGTTDSVEADSSNGPFVFLDETGTPVIMPRMTFEELDRLQRLDLGIKSSEDRHQVERVDIQARVNGNRVVMDVVIDVRLDPPIADAASIGPSSTRTYPIDLAMADMYLVEVVAVEGIENARFSFEEGGQAQSPGYRLHVPWGSEGNVRVRLKTSTAATRQGLNQAGLNLNLPRAPTRVELKVDAQEQLRWWDRELRLSDEVSSPVDTMVTAELEGNKRDLIRPIGDAGSGQFAIESNGG